MAQYRMYHTFLIVFFTISVSYSSIARQFKLGIENISHSFLKKLNIHKNGSHNVGLITNQTGVDQQGRRTVDILSGRGVRVVTMFVPEHGLDGTMAEVDVYDSVDKKTGITIASLYKNGSGKLISAEQLANIDVLVFDIQDSGMRHYTYISTLLQTLKVAAEQNKHFVVLDRPNPLGRKIEGPLVAPDLISFISVAPVPLRHGMTIGELARYFNKYVLDNPAKLHVVPMKNYDNYTCKEFLYPLSPNIRTVQSCYGYSFLGLLGEIEPFDVGVGTDQPFQRILLPTDLGVSLSQWNKFRDQLALFGIKSSLFEAVNKKKQKVLGVRLHIADIDGVNSFTLFMSTMQFFKNVGISLRFSSAFDKAVGTREVKMCVDGLLSPQFFFETIDFQLNEFYQKAQPVFIYKPFPRKYS